MISITVPATRILIVEDDERHASVMSLAFTGKPDFRLVATHTSAECALEHTDWSEVDVLISDLGLPGMGGVDLIALTRQNAPHVLCLAYTLNSEKKIVFSALRAGAQGYLLKGCSLLDLEQSVRKILAGECPVSPAIAGRLLDFFLSNPPQENAETLSTREIEIIRMLATGMISKEVADHLNISPHTVHGHLKKIYVKLQAKGRPQALERAKKLGYIP